MGKDVLFLFGSGISFATGMPNTGEILAKILDWNWEKTRFGFTHTTQINKKLVYQNIISLVYKRLVKERKSIKLFPIENECDENDVNYEDVYSVLAQILEYRNGLYNSASMSFLDKMWYAIGKRSKYPEKKWGNAVWDTITFFNWAIRDILLKTNNDEIPTKSTIKGLEFFDVIKENNDINNVTIFSLNHDLLIESYLGDLIDIPFRPRTKDEPNLKIFNKKYYDESKRFHLYKLHGSVNWFVPNKYPSYIRENLFECNPNRYDMEYYFEKISHYQVMPMILTGSGVKEFFYQRAIYSDLINIFRNKLESTNTIFVCGYGWRDSGINSIIIDWLSSDKNRKIIFFDKNISETESKTPKLLWEYWNNPIGEQIIHINNWISDCDVEQDIISNLL